MVGGAVLEPPKKGRFGGVPDPKACSENLRPPEFPRGVWVSRLVEISVGRSEVRKKGRKSAPPKYDRPARRLPRAAAEANRAVDMLRTGGDLDAVMQLGSAGGRGARGGAKRI